MSEPFDLAVIGSGPGGYRAAVLGALRGLRVAIIDRGDWGGCCLNRGCVPKKDWSHSARMLAAQRHFAGRGIHGTLSGDLGRAWEHQREVVGTVRNSYRSYLKHLKVDAFEGHARFLGPESIEVQGAHGVRTILARHSIIATGAAPVVPESFRLSEDRVIITADGERVEVDWVLLGTGRRPFTEGLGLDRIGVASDRDGSIRRDDTLQTTAPNVYAIGDVAGRWMTANHALSDATIAVENILGGNRRRQDGRFVPVVVYSAVEMARLGLDEDTAEDEELEPAVGFAAFETSPRALGQDEPEGFVRLIADMDSGALLGGEIIGGDAGELLHLLSLAPDRATALAWLARGIWNHPTRAEEILNATETLAAKWHLEDRIFGAPAQE